MFSVPLDGSGRDWSVALGVTEALVGLAVWVWPGPIAGATRREHTHWTARLVADILQVVLGVVLIARLFGTVRGAALIIGAVAIVAGGVEIATALARDHAPRPSSAL